MKTPKHRLVGNVHSCGSFIVAEGKRIRKQIGNNLQSLRAKKLSMAKNEGFDLFIVSLWSSPQRARFHRSLALKSVRIPPESKPKKHPTAYAVRQKLPD
jgi:hypothetical protein